MKDALFGGINAAALTAMNPDLPPDLDTYAAWLTAFTAQVAPGAPVLGHSFGSLVVAALSGDGVALRLGAAGEKQGRRQGREQQRQDQQKYFRFCNFSHRLCC